MDSIEELKEFIKKKDPKSIEEMYNVITEAMQKLPDLQDKIKGMQLSRGAIIDIAITIELIYNEIILITDKKEIVKDSFQNKTDFVKEIMKHIDKDKKYFSQELFDSMDRLVVIRNLFAHVPINYFSKEMKFDKEEYYYRPKVMELKNKTIKELNKEFVEISQKVIKEFDKVLILIKETIEMEKK